MSFSEVSFSGLEYSSASGSNFPSWCINTWTLLLLYMLLKIGNVIFYRKTTYRRPCGRGLTAHGEGFRSRRASCGQWRSWQPKLLRLQSSSSPEWGSSFPLTSQHTPSTDQSHLRMPLAVPSRHECRHDSNNSSSCLGNICLMMALCLISLTGALLFVIMVVEVPRTKTS